jgi:hypothetical protein
MGPESEPFRSPTDFSDLNGQGLSETHLSSSGCGCVLATDSLRWYRTVPPSSDLLSEHDSKIVVDAIRAENLLCGALCCWEKNYLDGIPWLWYKIGGADDVC